MKKVGMLLCLLFALTIFTTGCIGDTIERCPDMPGKMWLGSLFDFHFQLYIDDEPTLVHYRIAEDRLTRGGPFYDPLLTKIVFVHNETEAVGFPRNVVVAWPRPEPWMQRRVEYINEAILEDINPDRRRPEGTDPAPLGIEGLKEIYGLTYPITLADFVYNWESLEELIFSFTSHTIGQIATVNNRFRYLDEE